MEKLGKSAPISSARRGSATNRLIALLVVWYPLNPGRVPTAPIDEVLMIVRGLSISLPRPLFSERRKSSLVGRYVPLMFTCLHQRGFDSRRLSKREKAGRTSQVFHHESIDDSASG